MRPPAPERLSSPRGAPLSALSWADVQARVAEAEDFLLATTDPDGRPHVVPVLAVWLEGTICFVTFRQSRKTRNLERNDGCAVTVPGPDADLVLEGAAQLAAGCCSSSPSTDTRQILMATIRSARRASCEHRPPSG